MRTLANVRPTPEQLGIISRNRPGVEIIRGAAGSGKTTTALLRLRSLIGIFHNRKQREGRTSRLRVLILTYNRTLRGYIAELAHQQTADEGISLEVATFAKWAREKIGNVRMTEEPQREEWLRHYARSIPLDPDFVIEEVDYVMGRFLPENLDEYLTIRRDGRGISPRVERPLREKLLNEVIYPYQGRVHQAGLCDWNDLAVHLARNKLPDLYDVIVVDEAQDFSANQIRALNNQTLPISSLTFVVDTAQRIYARGYRWQETGITVRSDQVHRLSRNYRNTKQTAAFAAALIAGLPIDDDATLPDFSKSERDGDLPVVLSGRFSAQLEYAVGYIQNKVDLASESVAFLHPLGGGWFDCIRQGLTQAGLSFVEMSRRADWPTGSVSIGLSTLHSAKGLEFDHVIVLGLNAEVTQHGEDEEDDRLTMLRRLLAMGVGRARKNVVIGYKPEDGSRLVNYFAQGTYTEVRL